MARFSSRSLIVAALASSVALAGCTTPTPYKPIESSSRYATGFFDRQIENNRFVVSFAGNSVTSRERVERYLLFRAAELTLHNGGDYFSVVDRDTERKTDTQVTNFGGGFGGGFGGYGYWGPGWGYWGPQWRYARRGFGWGGWGGWGGGFGGDPFFNDVQVRQIDRYEAQAEIITGRGSKPAGDRFAFSAKEVVDRLGPTIEYPGDRRR